MASEKVVVENNETIQIVFDSRGPASTRLPTVAGAPIYCEKPSVLNRSSSSPEDADNAVKSQNPPGMPGVTSEVQESAQSIFICSGDQRGKCSWINKSRGGKVKSSTCSASNTNRALAQDSSINILPSTLEGRKKKKCSFDRPGLKMQSRFGICLCKTAVQSRKKRPIRIDKGNTIMSSSVGARPRSESVETDLERVREIPLVTLEEDDAEPIMDGVVPDGSTHSEAEVTELRRVKLVDLSGEERSTHSTNKSFQDETTAVKKAAPVTADDLLADFLSLDTVGETPLTSRCGGRTNGGHRSRLMETTSIKLSRTRRHLATAVRHACRTLTTPLGKHLLKRGSHRCDKTAIRGGLRGSSSRRRQATGPNPPPSHSQSSGGDHLLAQRAKRPIVIDGPNVGYAHGLNRFCSARGIRIAVDFFKQRGHRCVVFIPSHFRSNTSICTDGDLLEEMHREGCLAFTPSRRMGGKRIASYDDRYVVTYATSVGGVMLSRDQYRDVAQERDEWRNTIENRLLIPLFVGDQLMVPEDPLGRHGPCLAEFLTFPPGEEMALPSDVAPVPPSGLPLPDDILPFHQRLDVPPPSISSFPPPPHPPVWSTPLVLQEGHQGSPIEIDLATHYSSQDSALHS